MRNSLSEFERIAEQESQFFSFRCGRSCATLPPPTPTPTPTPTHPAMPNDQFPASPKIELDGLPYVVRMCDKIRMMAAGTLHEDLHANLGIAMDAWTCQFLGVSYAALKGAVLDGKSDGEVLAWARQEGVERPEHERDWWVAFMRSVGFRDRLAGRLQERIAESGLEGRDDIVTMFDYIDADEARG